MGKKMEKGRNSLGIENENNGSGGFPGFSCGCGIFRENTGIVRNSSISERPEIIIKNQEYYINTHSEIRSKKYFIVLKLKIPEPIKYRLR